VCKNDYQEPQDLLAECSQELISCKNNPRKSKIFQHIIYLRIAMVGCQINPKHYISKW